MEGRGFIYQNCKWGTNVRRFIEYQFPLTLQFPWKFPHNLTSITYVQLNIFPSPIHKKCFSSYDLVTICNFAEKLAQNKYIYVGYQNISSRLDVNCPLDFLKVLEILLKQNSLIFKISYDKVFLTVIASKQIH